MKFSYSKQLVGNGEILFELWRVVYFEDGTEELLCVENYDDRCRWFDICDAHENMGEIDEEQMWEREEYEKVQEAKNMYPAGTRVMAFHMCDMKAPPIGTWGTVTYVDDIGTVHVNWDDGSTYDVVYGYDSVIKEEDL